MASQVDAVVEVVRDPVQAAHADDGERNANIQDDGTEIGQQKAILSGSCA